MKKKISIILFLLNLNFICFGQSFVESEDFNLSEFDYETYYKKAEQTGEYGYSKVFLIDNNGKEIKEFEIFPESYENDVIVYESSEFDFENVKKIIRIEIAHCACYCETSKYYWFLTVENEWVELPIIKEGIYDFDLKRKDYVFNKNESLIELVEFQDEVIKENGNTTFKLKSKIILDKLEWNGTALSEK